MDDEDGTCLLDVLCDPQALNDFLHGTNELENEDLLINSSPGEPSLFADAPSPGSLLADDTPCQDTPPPGCVDLSFLEEALLGSPEEGGGPEVGQGGPVGASEEEEACDILRQSLQEADITEQTLALEAGLATPGEGLSLYNTPSTLLAPLTSQFLSKPFSAPPLPVMPRDTQVAVEPPQPSLLAVGPGCPSLKPAAPQLMGLLPGTVFPATSPDASFSLSPAQGSGMLIQKALPSLSRPLMTTTLRATAAPGILLPRGPLPIQPKLPVNIQPRLVQISPKPPGQKSSPGLTLVPGTAPPNILLSSSLGSKQPPANPHLSKPVSLQLVNQGGSIVIQPQSLFQGHNQFLLPSQTPVTISQPISAAQPLLTSANQQGPLVRGGAPPTGQLLDSTQILSAPPRQLNFSPVFTTPTGQLALRQGALLSGPLQLQSASPTVFQMPAQLAGTYTPQGQGQRGTLLHSTALGSHITLINGPGMLTPDMASISIVNGPSVVQGLPFTTQATRPRPGGPEGQYNLPQASVLLLPETSGLEKRSPSEESLVPIPQPNQQLHQHASQIRPAELQSPPLVTLLQPLSDGPLHSASLLPKDLVPQTDGQQVLEEVSSLAPQKQGLMHTLQQALELPSPSADKLAGTLPVQVAPHVSTLASQSETSTPTLPIVDQVGAPPAIPNPIEVITPTHPGIEQTVSQCSPLIGLTSLSTPPVTFSPASGQGEALSWSGLSKAATAVQPANPVSTVPSPLPVSVSVVPLQSAPLIVPVVSGGQTDLSIQQRTQGKPGAVFSVDSKALTFGLCPASPKIQGSQLQGQYNQRQHIQVTQIQTVLQSRTQVTSCMEMGTEEKVILAMRRHRFQQQLCLDHAAVLSPEANSPFMSLENAASCLLPYHTCAGNLPGQANFIQVDEQFEAVSGLLLKRATDMLKKYRQLLLGEAQQVSPSAEMVMLERLFLQAERGALVEERRKARLEPESFLMSLRKPVACPSGAAPAAPCPFLQSSSPPSPPSWALLSDRPPGLKTYRSSSRGALKLTIKHESGSRKVVHNSACDAAQTCPSDDKQEDPGQLTNGRDTLRKQGKESKGLPYLQNQTSKLSEGTQPLPLAEEAQHSKASGVIAGARTGACSLTTPDTQSAAPELPIPDSILCPPRSKRPRRDLPPDLPSPLPVGEDSTLNEHLQSAIDSILELQRLQGPSQDSRGASALEQAVNSILEGHL